MKKMNMRKNNKKKKRKIKYIIIILLIYTVFCTSFYYCLKDNKNINNEKFINILINNNNYNYLKEYKTINIVNSTMKFMFNIDITYPVSILNNTIFGSTTKKHNSYYSLEYNDDYSDMEELKDVSSYMEDPNNNTIDNPIIYIYNSHQLENYSSDNLDIYGITPNVLMASYILKEKLNKLNIPTIVEDTNMTNFLEINGWDHSYSYRASRLLILSKISDYSSIKYFIDIHRDSVDKTLTTTNIIGKNYAKVLFVVGKDYDTWEKNYDTATNINNLIDKYYPTLSRGILKKSGANVDGVYNQDISPNSMLIEIGSYNNNIEEVFNTITALSNILFKYINGDEK